MSDLQSTAKYREVTARMTGRMHSCAVCRKHKSLAGNTAQSIIGHSRLYRCAQCTANGVKAMRLKQAWAQLEFDMSKRGRCNEVSLETILQVRSLLGLDRTGIKWELPPSQAQCLAYQQPQHIAPLSKE